MAMFEPVMIGSGDRILAQSKGDINIRLLNGREWILKLVLRILLVLNLWMNLHS